MESNKPVSIYVGLDTIQVKRWSDSFLWFLVGRTYCGVSIEGQIQCWAPPDVDVPTPIPEGTFIEAIATIYLNACALDINGAAICWGDESGRYMDIPTTGVQSISQGYSSNLCMLMTDSTGRCWGEPYWASNVPEDIQFQQLQISDTHLCGVVDSGDIRCWGASSAFPQ